MGGVIKTKSDIGPIPDTSPPIREESLYRAEKARGIKILLADHPECIFKAVAEHYTAVIALSMTLRKLLEIQMPDEFNLPVAQDDCAKHLLEDIRRHHLKVFGSDPAWYTPEVVAFLKGEKKKCKRIGGCLHDLGHEKCCCDTNDCGW